MSVWQHKVGMSVILDGNFYSDPRLLKLALFNQKLVELSTCNLEFESTSICPAFELLLNDILIAPIFLPQNLGPKYGEL